MSLLRGFDYPVNLENPADFTFEGYVNRLREDSVFADKIFFPKAPVLFPFQKAAFRALDQYQYIFIEAPRGVSKSYMVGRWCAGKSLAWPARFVYTGPTYRQGKYPWKYAREQIEKHAKNGCILDLAVEMNGKAAEGAEIARLLLQNGSAHIALPMGQEGENIRGERAQVLVADEFFKMPKDLATRHVLPFLQGHKSPNSLGPKFIAMTSAEYQDCYAYELLSMFFLKKIREEDELAAQDPTYKRKYIVLDIQIEDAESEGYKIEWDILEQQLNGATPDEREQALHNKWIGTSGLFLPANLVDKCKSSEVYVEYEAQKGFDYGLSVDVATQLKGDFFVVDVVKFLGQDTFAIVNSFWGKGLTEDEMAWKIHQLNEKFNPSHIVMDPGGGGFAVQTALAKPKLVFLDGAEKVIKDPILLHNENRSLNGTRKLVLLTPHDEMVSAGFTAERSRQGEYINGVAHLYHLIYDGIKKAVSGVESKIFIPQEYQDIVMDGELQSEVWGRIEDSVRQLKLLHMKMRENEQGLKEIVKSKNGSLPLYGWRGGVHDGASALCFGYVCSRIYYALNGSAPREPGLIGVPRIASPYPELMGRPEIYENEIYRFNR